MDTRLSLLMNQLGTFYNNSDYIEIIKNIIDQKSIVSLRILDWFITNYSKKYRTIITTKKGESIDVYMNYKLKLKSYSKEAFDPFNRKNKIIFCYDKNSEKIIETSCGQLCFFKWCFENDILDFVRNNLNIIEQDMKTSLKIKKDCVSGKKRQPLSLPASRSISKTYVKHIIKFD
jgi:hypothetical protein